MADVENSVAVTGMGVALPLGVCSLGGFWDAVCSGRTALEGSSRRTARMPAWDVSDHVDSRQTRRMSPLSKLAIAACRKALDDAGLDRPSPGSALFFASKYGSTEFLREFHEGLILDRAASPFLFTNGVANAPAGHISLEYGTRGPCMTLMGGAQSAAFALQHASGMLGDGAADMALVGAAEELSDFFLGTLAGYHGALKSALPALGEGGVFLVLEPEERAAARGASPYALIRGAGFPSLGGLEFPGRPESRPDGARFLSLSASDGPGLERELRILGGLCRCGGGDRAAAVKFNLGEAHAASALAQVAAACLALRTGISPRRPEGLPIPAGLNDLFPAEQRPEAFQSALVFISDGEGPAALVMIEKPRD